MFDAFSVGLREGSELLLILLALHELLMRAGRRELTPWLGVGVLVGLLFCTLGLASFVTWGISLWLEAALTLAMGMALMIMSPGTMASAEAIRRHTSGFIEHQLDRPNAGLHIAGFAAFSTVRETMGVALFARSIAPRFSIEDVAAGLLMGLLACSLMALAWRWMRVRSGMLWAFRLSALYLLVLSAQMAIHGGAMLLLSGMLPFDEAELELALQPYLRDGEYHWALCAMFLALPVGLCLRTWWRRSAVGG